MLAHILGIVAPILAICGAGWLYGRWKDPDLAATNQVNMDVLVPCLIVHVLAQKNFEPGHYLAWILGGVVVVLGSGLLALPVARLLGIAPRTFVPPMMFTNTGNMGLPLAVFAFGERLLPAMVVLFLTTNTLNFTLGIWIMNRRVRITQVLRIPMIVATLVGLALSLGHLRPPGPLDVALGMLGQAAIPLMLFSLGVRLTTIELRDWRVGAIGALFCPLSGLAVALALLPVLGLHGNERALFLMFATLPPAVLNFMIAEAYQQEPMRVASIVMLGNLTALVTIPAILAFTLG